MAEQKAASKAAADVQAAVAKQVDREQEQGYRGRKVDPLPNSAYSLESGPDAPSSVPEDGTAITQRHINPPKEG
jgi:hypothetical protein